MRVIGPEKSTKRVPVVSDLEVGSVGRIDSGEYVMRCMVCDVYPPNAIPASKVVVANLRTGRVWRIAADRECTPVDIEASIIT